VKEAPGMKNGYLSPQEAAEKLAVSLDTIRRMLRTGAIRGTKVGRQWRIHQRDLDAFLGPDTRAEELEALSDQDQLVGDRTDLRMLIEELPEDFIRPLCLLLICLRDKRKDFHLLQALIDLLTPLRNVPASKEMMEVARAIQEERRSGRAGHPGGGSREGGGTALSAAAEEGPERVKD